VSSPAATGDEEEKADKTKNRSKRETRKEMKKTQVCKPKGVTS
jgi:hypothetical protein